MRIVEFDYKPEFAVAMGIDHTHQTGKKNITLIIQVTDHSGLTKNI